jgi:hypothetical protein
VFKPECVIINDKRKKLVLKEKRSELRLQNEAGKDIKVIHIDGCEITENTVSRCDYVILYDNLCIYLELKGSEISHAFEQLANTIRLKNIKDRKKIAVVVSFRCPLATAEINKAQQLFRKVYNANLLVKGSPYQFVC